VNKATERLGKKNKNWTPSKFFSVPFMVVILGVINKGSRSGVHGKEVDGPLKLRFYPESQDLVSMVKT
jgi:hypothetical protein